MNQLTPSGWIGVLIGIVVFVSIVGPVKGNAKKCPADTSAGLGVKKEFLSEMTTVFAKTNFQTVCGGGGNKLCLQYVPPPKADASNRNGRAYVLAECDTGCKTGEELITKIGKGYECKVCNVDQDSTCKFITDIKSDLTECYVYSKLKTVAANLDAEKKHLCMDECHYFYASANDVLTVGCQYDIKTTLGTGVPTTKCPGDDATCEKIISHPLCFSKTGLKLETVEDITKAMARENWKVPCEKDEKCIQYYPPPPGDKSKRVGRAKVLMECSNQAAVSGAALTNKIGDGYLSHPCDATGSGIRDCKKLDDVKRETVECYDYSGDKNNADATTLKQKKIYCMDKCRFLEVGKVLTVGCAGDFKIGSPADCPDTDQLCAKMILKSDKNPDSPGGGGGTTGMSTAAPTKPKHGNRVTVPTGLIGSMAILLFAASQYVTILN